MPAQMSRFSTYRWHDFPGRVSKEWCPVKYGRVVRVILRSMVYRLSTESSGAQFNVIPDTRKRQPHDASETVPMWTGVPDLGRRA